MSGNKPDPDSDWDRPQRQPQKSLPRELWVLLVALVGLAGRIGWVVLRILSWCALILGSIVAGLCSASRGRK